MNILDFFTGTPFLFIGVAGLVGLLIAAALDGLFDVFDVGDGPVSFTTVAAFLALFGFVAAGLEYVGVDTTVAIIGAAIAGVLASVGAWQLSRFFKKGSTSASHSVSSLVGTEAVVRIRIREAGVGEIALRRNGQIHTYTAKADTETPEGVKVTIKSAMSNTLMFVEPVDAQTSERKMPSDAQIQEWADEAERGYDLKALKPDDRPEPNN